MNYGCVGHFRVSFELPTDLKRRGKIITVTHGDKPSVPANVTHISGTRRLMKEVSMSQPPSICDAEEEVVEWGNTCLFLTL